MNERVNIISEWLFNKMTRDDISLRDFSSERSKITDIKIMIFGILKKVEKQLRKIRHIYHTVDNLDNLYDDIDTQIFLKRIEKNIKSECPRELENYYHEILHFYFDDELGKFLDFLEEEY